MYYKGKRFTVMKGSDEYKIFRESDCRKRQV